MKLFSLTLASLFFLPACREGKTEITSITIARGQMPNVVEDNSGNIHLVYGNGDSILYSYSSDGGKRFSAPTLLSVIPKLAASHMRGPQIIATANGLAVTACNDLGDIFSFVKDQSGIWSQTMRVNGIFNLLNQSLSLIIQFSKPNRFYIGFPFFYDAHK